MPKPIRYRAKTDRRDRTQAFEIINIIAR